MAFATPLRPALAIYLGTATQHLTSSEYAESFTKSQVPTIFFAKKTGTCIFDFKYSVSFKNVYFQGMTQQDIHLATFFYYWSIIQSFVQLNESKHRNI